MCPYAQEHAKARGSVRSTTLQVLHYKLSSRCHMTIRTIGMSPGICVKGLGQSPFLHREPSGHATASAYSIKIEHTCAGEICRHLTKSVERYSRTLS